MASLLCLLACLVSSRMHSCVGASNSKLATFFQRKNTFPLDASPNPSAKPSDRTDEWDDDDRLPSSNATIKAYMASLLHEEDLEAGRKFLTGPYGELSAKYFSTMQALGRYWSETVHGSGHTGNEQSHTKPPLNMTHVEHLVGPWRSAFQQHLSSQGKNYEDECPDDVLQFEVCVHHFHCDVSPQVPHAFSAETFAVMVEVEASLQEHIFKDIKLIYLRSHPDHNLLHSFSQTCEDEASNFLEEKMSQRQSIAVAAVEKVAEATQRSDDFLQRALALSLLAGHHESNVADLNVEQFEKIWEETCKAVGCRFTTWFDIGHALHDHTAELIEAKAPGHAIRKHVKSMRRAHQNIARTGSILLEEGVNHTFFAASDGGHGGRGSKRYNKHVKRAGGWMDGAMSVLKGTNKRVSTNWWCWKGSVAWNSAYVFNLPKNTASWGISFQLRVSRSFGLDLMKLLVENKPPSCPPWGASLDLNILIGVVAGIEGWADFRGGVSLTIGISFSGCDFKFGVKAGAGAGLAWKTGPQACIFGDCCGGCKESGTIGFAFWCCDVSLTTGASNCG